MSQYGITPEDLEQFRNSVVGLQQCASAFKTLAAAMRKLPPPPSMREIASFRLARHFDQYGLGCVLSASFWRWAWAYLRG